MGPYLNCLRDRYQVPRMTATKKSEHPAMTPAINGVLILGTPGANPGTSVWYRHSPAPQVRRMLLSPKMLLIMLFISGSSNAHFFGSPGRCTHSNLAGPRITLTRNSLRSMEPFAPHSM